MATLKSIKNKYLSASDGDVLGVTTNTENVSALSFKLATADSLSKFNMVDGFTDDYNDATGVDAAGSTNETRNSANYYSGSTSTSPTVTGGTISTSGDYTFHYFQASGNFITNTAQDMEILLVAGGGGGGRHSGGGGGGGGVIYQATRNITAATHAYVQGAGGAGQWSGPYPGDPGGAGTTGGDSTFNGLTAKGGGGGGAGGVSVAGLAGGSGGGTGRTMGAGGATIQGTQPGDSGTYGFGFIGGTGAPGSGAPNYTAAGGGGAGAQGGASSSTHGGPGGAGKLLSSFVAFGTDSSNNPSSGSNGGYFAGGGGGIAQTGGGWAPGGIGGGARSGNSTSGNDGFGRNGIANTGGGGGGSQYDGTTGANAANGGSGTLIIKRTTLVNTSANMTLQSNAFTAQTAPTTARIILDEESYKGDTTLNTDLKAYASRDNGTTFTQMTLASQATLTDTSTLLMHMDGANDGTVFTDSARPSLTVTKAGTPVTKTAEKKFGTASCYLAGSTDWLKLPASDNWSFAASADFTIECWCKWSTAASYVGMIASKTEISGVYNGWSLRTDSSGANRNLSFNFWDNAGSVTFSCNGTSNIGDGSWHHVAATRASDTVRVFVDGALENSGTYAGAIHGTSSGGYGLQIGMDYLNATGSGPMHGYVDEVRISNVARWTDAFTPPTAAYSGYEGDRQLLSGSVDISGQPSGTNVKYKIETLNQAATKQTRVYGTSMAWA